MADGSPNQADGKRDTRRLNRRHQDMVRAKIQASYLIGRLHGHVTGKVELSRTQIEAAKILLNKSVPDLQRTELVGEGGGAVIIQSAPLDDAL